LVKNERAAKLFVAKKAARERKKKRPGRFGEGGQEKQTCIIQWAGGELCWQPPRQEMAPVRERVFYSGGRHDNKRGIERHYVRTGRSVEGFSSRLLAKRRMDPALLSDGLLSASTKSNCS